jgi:methenyltetrahydrofolate cyclohydrolase
MSTGWMDASISAYLGALGSSAPTPGGGSAAALAGALSCALGRMVVSVARDKEPTAGRDALLAAFAGLETRFLSLAREDEEAFAQVMAALHLPREDAGRAQRVQSAIVQAARVPLHTAGTALTVLERLREAEPHASRSIVSDVGAAAHLAVAALRASLLNVSVNARSLTDAAAADDLDREVRSLGTAGESALTAVIGKVEDRLAPRRS